MVKAGELLALPVDGTTLFPIFQFEGKTVRAEMIEVAKILTQPVGSFTATAWLHAPAVMAGNAELTNEAFLRTDPEAVRSAAKEMAKRWAV